MEESAAFARLVADGLSVEAVARHFAVTAKFVRKRLALDRLSPRVREAWRAGAISPEGAEVLTTAGDHAAQDRLLDDHPTEDGNWLPGPRLAAIKTYLQRGALRSDCAFAVYVGAEAYTAAGGCLEEYLFEDYNMFLDAALLRKLAREKMLRDGQAIIEENGYGFCLLRADVAASDLAAWSVLPADYTAKDHDDLAAIDALEAEEEDHRRRQGTALGAADLASFEQKREVVHRRARLRGSTAAQRATAGILVDLDRHGALRVEMGIVRPSNDPTAEPGEPAKRKRGRQAAPAVSEADASGPTPEPPAAADGSKALVAVMDAARTMAWQNLVAETPDLAIMLAAAALGSVSNGSPLRIRPHWQDSNILRLHSSFLAGTEYLLGVEKTHRNILAAFAAAVACTINVAPESPLFGARPESAELDKFARIVANWTGEAYDAAMCRALDHVAYFEAATKAACLRAVAEIGGDPKTVGRLSKPDLVAAAALLCQDKGWLPPELRAPKRDKSPPASDTALVDATAAALAADEHGEPCPPAGAQAAAAAFETPLGVIRYFLDHFCVADDSASVRGSILFATFRQSMPAEAQSLFSSAKAFHSCAAGAGVDTRRDQKGILYSGLRVRGDADGARAELAAERF